MNTIAAKDVQRGDEIEGWKGYIVLSYELHPNGTTGRIVLQDRYRSRCWTPKDPDDEVVVLNR